MRKVASFATMASRENYLDRAVESMKRHVDKVYVYDNSKKLDLTDNGKFAALLSDEQEPCYFYSCDDDLIYSKAYVDLLHGYLAAELPIVTIHGRILRGEGMHYYKDHEQFRFSQEVNKLRRVDVAGTGVTAVNTAKFNPGKVALSSFMCMSDLVFSLLAAERNVQVHLLPHKFNLVRDQYVPKEDTILGKFVDSCETQNILADAIYKRIYYGSR